MNQVILMGRLARDPEMKNANGLAVARITVCTNKDWKDESGEKKSKAEFHNCVAFRKTAELCGKYLTKGKQVLVQGELQTRSYEKDGVKKYATEVIVNNVQFLGSADKPEASVPTELETDQLPF